MVRMKLGHSSTFVVSTGTTTRMCVFEESVASPDTGTWPWMNLCILEISGLGRVVSHCGFPLATTAGRNAHTDRSGWVVCAAVWLLERNHGLAIAAPFARICQSESQCLLLSALDHAVQELARIHPVFENVERGEPLPLDACEQDVFLPPARVLSLLALARAGLAPARHVGFQPGSELRASGHSLLNSSRDATDLPPQ